MMYRRGHVHAMTHGEQGKRRRNARNRSNQVSIFRRVMKQVMISIASVIQFSAVVK